MGPLKGWRRWAAGIAAMVVATILIYGIAVLVGGACISVGRERFLGMRNHLRLMIVAFSAMLFLLLIYMGPIFGLAIASWVIGIADRRMKIPSGCCQRCGYDLTGNVSGRCPECGMTIN
jgi:hypothetical protein